MTDDRNPLESAFDDLRRETVELDTAAARRKLERRRIPGRAIAATAVIVIVAAVALSQLRENPTADLDVTPADEIDSTLGTASLDGTSWILESAETSNGLFGAIGGLLDQYTLVFEADTLGGRNECNSFGADYERTGTSIVIDALGTTEALCSEELTFGDNYLESLASVTSIEVTETNLLLTGPSVELRYLRADEVPLGQIVDRPWRLVEITEGSNSFQPEGDPAVLQLSADGAITGSTGCRTLDGEYVVSGNEIRTTRFSAAGECPTDLQDQDGIVVTALGDGFTAEVVEETLTIRTAEHALMYRPATTDDIGLPPSTVDFPVPSRWELIDGEGPSGNVIDADESQTLEIDEHGNLVIDLGCKSAVGFAQIEGASFTVAAIGVRDILCRAEATALIAAMKDVAEWALDGQTGLILTGPSTELVFERTATNIEDPTAGFVQFLHTHFATQDVDYAGACSEVDALDDETICSGDPRQTDDADVYAALIGLALDYTGDQGAPFATGFGVADLIARRLGNGEWEFVELHTVGLPEDS